MAITVSDENVNKRKVFNSESVRIPVGDRVTRGGKGKVKKKKIVDFITGGGG